MGRDALKRPKPKDESPNKGHLRRLGATLALMDEALARFSYWADGNAHEGACYREVNDLSPQQRKQLARRIEVMRERLERLRTFFGLQPEVRTASKDIWTTCVAFREHLVELGPRYLKQFGTVPPKLAERMEKEVPALLAELDAVEASVKQPKA